MFIVFSAGVFTSVRSGAFPIISSSTDRLKAISRLFGSCIPLAISDFFWPEKGVFECGGRAVNEEVAGSNPAPATNYTCDAGWSSDWPAFVMCAGHAQQLGGESPLTNLMEVKV